jgi:hypothetical protein
VVNVHALVATGVNADGHPEILGLDVASAEDGAGWLAFLVDIALSVTTTGSALVVIRALGLHTGHVEYSSPMALSTEVERFVGLFRGENDPPLFNVGAGPLISTREIGDSSRWRLGEHHHAR